MLLRFTKKELTTLPVKDKRYRVKDSVATGLYVNVYPSGTKTFSVIKRAKNGRPRTVTLGKFPDISIHTAREEAGRLVSELQLGNYDSGKAVALTIQEALDSYIETRYLVPNTIKDYRRSISTVFGSMLNMPLSQLDGNTVLKLYDKHVKRSKARTNNAMRVMRAVYNYHYHATADASGAPLLPTNPVLVLNNTKQHKTVG